MWLVAERAPFGGVVAAVVCHISSTNDCDAVTESAARRSGWLQAVCLSRHSYGEGGNGRRGSLQVTE